MNDRFRVRNGRLKVPGVQKTSRCKRTQGMRKMPHLAFIRHFKSHVLYLIRRTFLSIYPERFFTMHLSKQPPYNYSRGCRDAASAMAVTCITWHSDTVLNSRCQLHHSIFLSLSLSPSVLSLSESLLHKCSWRCHELPPPPKVKEVMFSPHFCLLGGRWVCCWVTIFKVILHHWEIAPKTI